MVAASGIHEHDIGSLPQPGKNVGEQPTLADGQQARGKGRLKSASLHGGIDDLSVFENDGRGPRGLTACARTLASAPRGREHTARHE
jgi:hypothetical protein